ncbi:MAG: ATP-binding protein [Balneolales bacterium]
MKKTKAVLNWSGGKDSSLCLHRALRTGTYEIPFLFTTVYEPDDRIAQHGVRRALLERQAESTGLALRIMGLPALPSMETYNSVMKKNLTGFKNEGIHASIFGDINLEDLRAYRENQLAEAGIEGVFPLWNLPTGRLAEEFIGLGFKAIVVCIDGLRLDSSFTGREYDRSFLGDLPGDVDPCGENGEFHTFVYDGPIFQKPVPFTRGEIIYREYTPPEGQYEAGFWFCDLVPEQ